jgi:hypothetical protein
MDTAIACTARASYQIATKNYEGAFNLLRTSLLSLLSARKMTCRIRQGIESPSREPQLYFSSTGWEPVCDRFYSGSFVVSREYLGNPVEEAWTQRHVDFCSAACLFNMALACHMEYESSQDCARRRSLLSQARILYLTSYEVLQKYPIQPSDSVVLLILALCANMVDVEMEFGQLNEIRFWLQILKDASHAINPTCLRHTAVFSFFEKVYVAPGNLIAAQAA